MKTKTLKLFETIFVLTVLLQGCAPVFSELQSARTVGKNKVEVTPSFTSILLPNDDYGDLKQNHFGLQAAYGLTSKIDLRLRYEHIKLSDGENNSEKYDILAFGPKFSLVEDIVAFSLPFGRVLGSETDDTWEMQPSLLFTFPISKDKIELTLAPKYIIPFCEDCENMFAINLGFSLSKDVSKWAIRPEYGILFTPESGSLGHFSIGLSYVF